jgi:hypothetical protein
MPLSRTARTTVASVLMVSVLSGCATILGGGTSQGISLTGEPSGVQYTIRAASGIQLTQGQTPSQVRLPRNQEYQIEFSAPGYQSQKLALTKGLNGWIWGNLLVGWVIGFGVDFIGGAAYKLEPSLLDVRMVRANGEEAPTVSAVVRLMNADGTLIREVTLPMMPIDR